MYKNLVWKIVLVAVLVLAAVWRLFPPSKTLRPGIDLAGGTSLIYEINTQGLNEEEKRGLSDKMITVLRRRVDPDNIYNFVWRPQGNSRFEIQMPLASAEARQKRQVYETARTELLAENVTQALVMRALGQPPEERAKKFGEFAAGDPNKLTILENLARVYDERKELQTKRTDLEQKLKTAEDQITKAKLDLDLMKAKRADWAKLTEQELADSLKKEVAADANDNIDLLAGYVKTYAQWTQTLEQITDPENGKNIQYADAKRQIDKLNLSEDQIDRCLDLPPKSVDRREAVEQLKTEFPDRSVRIDKVVAAFDDYRPFKGRLDDPKDLQRMLTGAGILEFRVLPTAANPQSDPDLMAGYVDSLKEKGPKYASDNKYIWCEIETGQIWRSVDEQKRPSITGKFGNKTYVLASNKPEQIMLQGAGEKKWKLEKATQGQDQYGRRAISFMLDERGGNLFAKLTSENIGRPLCILLDGIAISAPNIESKIRRQGIITGSYTETDQANMIDKLNAGSLPAMLIEQPISVNTIGPSIGADNRDQGIRAGVIGLIAVIATMLIYYMLAGSIADVALLMNILFVLAIMAFVRATFTLPGIAGIILTIGMSVDANVLIYERIREEQQKGASLRIAIANGYQRAFTTILDSNLTTFITAAILYWVASEEVKGFAIVLMLGIASSMFTALFVTRIVFDLLLARRIIKDHLYMLRLIHSPNINWMRLRPVFLSISLLLVIGGLAAFFTATNKYDIEFTGGTSAQINFKNTVMLTRQQVEDRIRPLLASVSAYSVGKPIGQAPNGESIFGQYQIDTTDTNKIIIAVAFPKSEQHTPLDITRAITNTQNQAAFSAELTNLAVTQDAQDASKFIVTTSQMNEAAVKEILDKALPAAEIAEPQFNETVNNAILDTFADELQIQQSLQPTIASEEKITQKLIDSYPELADFIGGIKIACGLERPAAEPEIRRRLSALQFKPDTQNLRRYPYRILTSDLNSITDPNQELKSFVYVSAEQEAALRELSEEDWTQFVSNERTKILAAAELETSLPRVRQFDPSVGSEAKTRALIAIVLSLFAIVAYIWLRFGNLRYGLAAIIALVHDVSITLGAVIVCTYIAGSPIGEKLLIGDFKINLAMIAALLTLIGYSLNDTIVVFDRIRENRGKAKELSPQVINNSINQTMSRTILTGFTTFIVVLIMYVFGGPNLRGFNFAIVFGIIIGTYSSVAIAAPILLIGAKRETAKRK
jgi:SecD/SecF fusion protein